MSIDHSLLTHVNQIVVQRAGDLGPQVASDVQIRRQSPVGGGLKSQPVRGIAGHPVIYIGAKAQQPASAVALSDHFDGEKRRIIHADADLLDWCHQKVLAILSLEDCRKQPNQRRPANRRPHVKPRTVTGDSHIEIAAERRIPKMHRRQCLSGGADIRSLAGCGR